MSLPVDDVIAVLREHVKDSTVLNAIAKDLLQAEREAKAEQPRATAPKSRFVALVRGDEALRRAVAGGCWIVSVPSGEDPSVSTYGGQSLITRLARAAKHQSEAPSRRRPKKGGRIKTWAELFRWLRPKAIKASESPGLRLRVTEPCEVVVLTTEEVQ